MISKKEEAMEATDYCDYNLSKKLKECGFDWKCNHYWYKVYANRDYYELRTAIEDDYNNCDCTQFPYCSAPTLYHAQKWLREVKKIDVLVFNCACGYLWEVSKTDSTLLVPFDDNGNDRVSGCWTTYEAALSAGIEAAL